MVTTVLDETFQAFNILRVLFPKAEIKHYLQTIKPKDNSYAKDYFRFISSFI
jgi:hypothetical protein